MWLVFTTICLVINRSPRAILSGSASLVPDLVIVLFAFDHLTPVFNGLLYRVRNCAASYYLNEIVRLRLDQLHWNKGFVLLEATKTENERDIPLWGSIHEIVQAWIRNGLTSDRYLFARATTPTYDNAIARACRNAGKVAKLDYDQAHGFTCHNFRHTAITDWRKSPETTPGP